MINFVMLIPDDSAAELSRRTDVFTVCFERSDRDGIAFLQISCRSLEAIIRTLVCHCCTPFPYICNNILSHIYHTVNQRFRDSSRVCPPITAEGHKLKLSYRERLCETRDHAGCKRRKECRKTFFHCYAPIHHASKNIAEGSAIHVSGFFSHDRKLFQPDSV